MFLRTIVDLSFLTLVIVLIMTLLSDKYDTNNMAAISLELQGVRKDMMSTSNESASYLEGKINRVAETSDSYQTNLTRRIKVLELRIDTLAESNSDKVVNTNTNIINK